MRRPEGSGGRPFRGGSRAVLLTALLAALLAGCVEIPTTGPVHFAESSPTARQSPPVRVIAEGPRPGQPPMQIVHGFLEAMRSYRPNFPTARKFLAPSVRELWNPGTILVYDSDVGVSVTSENKSRLTIKAPKVAEVRPDGSWTPARADAELVVHLRLAKVNGGWRIVNPPDTLIMSRADFDREYSRYELFFFDPDFQTLVPDAVYLPVRGNTATLLVQALLRGPSTWLSPAVRTAFPTRSRLAASSVPVEGGVAHIDLNSRILDLSDAQRRLLAAQLAWTLAQAGIHRTEVTVEQAPLTIDGEPVTVNIEDWRRYDPTVAQASTVSVAVSHQRVMIVDDSGLSPMPGPLGRKKASLRACAISMYGDRLAAVSSDGDRVLVGSVSEASPAAPGENADPQVVLKGKDFLEPSWDRAGVLWAVDRAGGTATVHVVATNGKAREIKVRGLTGEDVRGLAVSRDGARLAALVQEGGRTRLEIARIQRESGLSVEGLHRVPISLTRMTDVAWSDIDQIVAVGHTRHEQPATVVVSSDGSTMTELGGAPAARTVAAAPNVPLILGATDGMIYVENEQYRWVTRGRGGHPAYPG